MLGWEHGTGIFVSEVHPGSEAAKQGLQVGLNSIFLFMRHIAL